MRITEEFLQEYCSESDLVRAWHTYCDANAYYEDDFYAMEDLDDILDTKKPSDIAYMIADNDFRYDDTYFKYDDYNLESTSDPIDWMDLDLLADYINEHDCEFDDIPDIWDRLQEDEEDE